LPKESRPFPVLIPMGDVIFRHTCCYFSPLISFGIFKEVPHLGSESWITEMGMPQPEKGHVFGNKLPLNALPNLQDLLDLQVLTCTLLRP